MSDTREYKIITSVDCPRCGAGIGQKCRNPVPHQTERGPEDRRSQPQRCHMERRRAWQIKKGRR